MNQIFYRFAYIQKGVVFASILSFSRERRLDNLEFDRKIKMNKT
jgi:hypothetical protein